MCYMCPRVQPLHIFIVCLTIGLFSIIPRNSYYSITDNEIHHCRKYWWSNVLLVNNLLPVFDIVGIFVPRGQINMIKPGCLSQDSQMLQIS